MSEEKLDAPAEEQEVTEEAPADDAPEKGNVNLADLAAKAQEEAKAPPKPKAMGTVTITTYDNNTATASWVGLDSLQASKAMLRLGLDLRDGPMFPRKE